MSIKSICTQCLPLIRKYAADKVFETKYSAAFVEKCFGRKLGLGQPADAPDLVPEEIKRMVHDTSFRKKIICGDDELYLIRSDYGCCTRSTAVQRKESSCLADVWANQQVSTYHTIIPKTDSRSFLRYIM